MSISGACSVDVDAGRIDLRSSGAYHSSPIFADGKPDDQVYNHYRPNNFSRLPLF